MARELSDRSLWTLDTFRVPSDARGATTVVVDGPEGRHAARVLRVRPGALARVIDGEGWEAVVRVVSVASGAFEGAVVDARLRERREGATLTVAQGLLKGRAFDEVVRRCSELGVAEVVPLLTARAEIRRGPDDARIERWRGIALAAVKQSRGVFVPAVTPVATVAELAERFGAETRSYVAWEEGSIAFRDALRADRRPGPFVAVVGPEGGLEAGEVALLASAGARPVSLGGRILRADWAAAALGAALSHETGGLLP